MSNKVSYFQNLQQYGAVTTDHSDKRQEKKAGKTSESFNNTLIKTQNSIETKIKSKKGKLNKLRNNKGNLFQRVSSKYNENAIQNTEKKSTLLKRQNKKSNRLFQNQMS